MRTALARFAAATLVAGCGVATAQPPAGFDPAAMADSMFKRSDKNGDGKITRDEVAGSRMERSFDETDANHDGVITPDEFKTRMTARMADWKGRGGNGGPPPAPAPVMPPSTVETSNTVVISSSSVPSNSPSILRPTTNGSGKKEEDKRPFVSRFGNLPKEVPAFFHELDGDQDGMIGLYEWRRNKEPLPGGIQPTIAEFVKMDLNGDGYLTPDEYIRYKHADIEAKPDGKTTTVARIRGEPIGRTPTVQAKAEVKSESKADAKVESASTDRKRGQRRERTEGGKNPFLNR